jgi:hypothetical protein
VYVPGGRLSLVVSDNLVVNGDHAQVDVRVDAADPARQTTSHTWKIDLVKADTSDVWLVEEAQLIS